MAVLAPCALALAVVAVIGGSVFAAVRGLRAWRALRRFQRTVGAGMVEISRGMETVEARVARIGEGALGLERATAQLQRSLATLSVMTAAAADARPTLRALAFLRR